MKHATGQKVKKTITKNGTTVTTDYLDGFQYKNTVLEFFGHAEGFVASGSYVYQYKDQLGNVRMSYHNVSGTPTIINENHYYPYGLKHAGYGTNTSSTNAAHKYRYNSREWQDEEALNLTAMDFRMYDNALGRFYGMDALSEKNHYLSPFQFADGNPVFFSDPSGLTALKHEQHHNEIPYDNGGMEHSIGGGGDFDVFSPGGGSGGDGSGGGLDGVNVVVLDSNANDPATKNNLAAIKDLDSSVLIIIAKNMEDFFSQLKDGLGENKISNLIFLSHGNYNDTGFFIGKDYLSKNAQFKKLGERLKPFVTSDTNIAFSACHIGAGKRLKSSEKMIQHLANSSGATVFANMTWGRAGVDRFRNKDIGEKTPILANFNKLPKIDKATIQAKPNAVSNLGNFLLLKPNSNSKIINGVYFTNLGNIKY